MSVTRIGNATPAGFASRVDPAGPVSIWPPVRVDERFETLADQNPSAPAILTDDLTLTYSELDQRANALAHALLAHALAPEEPVGVLTARSPLLPLAFLGILKAGGAYVPMGADLPAERLASMASQSSMRCLIALDGLEPPSELLAATPLILRPEALGDSPVRPARRGHSASLAAILFTSGSTGRPKGVLLQHDGCINMGYGHIAAQNITPDDRILLASAPGFIMGFRELCLPILAGAAYVPASRALLDDPNGLLEAMSRHRVTVALFTPSYLRLFNGAVPQGLRCLLTAGERPNPDDSRAYARKLDCWNIHGATEVCGTICMLPVDPAGSGPLASGRPFSNTSVYLLDDQGCEVPPGESGEIHVVGVGVARGYLGQPGLTAQRFFETRYGRAFRTNDLGRWNDSGYLESLGRMNDVVKVSGQAVSLGEIDQTLLRYETVRYAATMQHDGKLIAFVQCDGPAPSSLADWHRILGRTLPAYMLPANVTTLPKMPVNFNDKVDRQALVALAEAASHNITQGTPAQGPLEQRIAAVWEELLGVSPVMRDDNFFALGGTSLLAIAIAQRLHSFGERVTAQTVLVSATVAALAAKLEHAPSLPAAAPTSEPREGPATAGQEDFWIAARLGLEAAGSQIARVLAIRGAVPEPARWQAAWARLVARHAALRTAFIEEAGGRIHWHTAGPGHQSPPFTLDRCDSLEAAGALLATRAYAPLPLASAPLARAGLVEYAGETLFWFTVHHAVVDGLSARILQEEMHALLLNETLPPTSNGIVDASLAEQHYLASDLATRDRDYWQHQLAVLPAEAFNEFPTDRHRPASPSGKKVASLVERLDAPTVAALTRLAQRQHAGLHALLLALLAAEARRRDGRSQVLIGSGLSVRPPGADRALGYFVNPLPLVLAVDPTLQLAARVQAAQASLNASVEHGGYPASLLYREFRRLHPHARPEARTSLFDIALTANPSRTSGDASSSFSLAPHALAGELAYPAAGIDLSFSHEPLDDGGLELALAWNADVFYEATARAWLAAFAGWARWVAEDADRAAAPLPALLPAEAACLDAWEYGPVVPRPARRCHELVEDVVDRAPDRPAVISETGVQTYAELDRQANRIAHTLLARGVARQESVAVLTACSAQLPSTVVGIWKAGAVYVPLAVEHPPERLAYLVADAGARTLLVLDGHPVPPALARAVQTILRLEDCPGSGAERPQISGSPQDLAFIVYTSGSTGMPKGVLLQHDALINVGLMTAETTGLTPEDRVSLVATPGFDASLWEMSVGLMNGMALVPVSRALRDDPWALKRWYTKYGVTMAFHTPSYLRVSKETPFVGMRVLLTGGETPTHDDARCYAGHLALWNAYGPTETTIYVTAERTPPNPSTDRPLPTGRPQPNCVISIRRDNGDRVPPGVIAEVWIGGLGVTRGYLNNPELTAQRFIPTPEGRFYRSGDLGRWTGDGLLELAGRMDHQVKFHGQRLELEEIDRALMDHPSVAEAITIVEASANDTKALRAYVRLHPAAAMPSEADWHAHLESRLPLYMVPASVIAVPVIPLTANGKVDRELLLRTPRPRPDGAGKTPPLGDLENRLAQVWAGLLGDTISREDNFFALGGNSLLAVSMAHLLSREFSRPVPARALFAAPTLAGFAQQLRPLLDEAPAVPPAAARSDLATEGQREFYIAEKAGLDTRTFTIPVMRLLDRGPVSYDDWNRAWAAMVSRHDALRTYFYEDVDGRLRRATAPTLPASLETATCADAASARTYIRQRQGLPFRMTAAPLWRAGLVHQADTGQYRFWLALHHSVGDGHSVGILWTELNALLRGESLPPLTCDLAQSAAREEAYLDGPQCTADARYWRDLLARLPDTVFEEAPLDCPRSAEAKPGNHRFETRLDSSISGALKTLARAHSASLHALMLTLLAAEARRRTGRAHLLIGTTASIRESDAEAQVVGYYVNMLPVACHTPPGLPFGAALDHVQQALASSMEHARYPFARIYQDLRATRSIERHPSRYPLFDLAVTGNPVVGQAGEPVPYELTDASPGQDMVLIHEESEDGALLLQWHVNAALYTRETALSWFHSLCGWASWLAEDVRRAAEPLPPLLPSEAALLESWEHGPHIPRPRLRFHELFERVLDSSPEQPSRPAVVTESGVLTYAELEQEANAIAHALLARGIAAGAVVGVLTGRSPHLPAAVLGISKAGAAYLPLAADLPAERLSFMAADAAIGLLLVLDGLDVPPALAHEILRPEALEPAFSHRPPRPNGDSNLAYILYTSGSTGQPKGTLISHDSYVNSLLSAGELLGLTPDDRSLMFSSPSFDVSLSDIGMPLAFGASVCPVPYDVLSSPNRFRAFLSTLHVTLADLTPTYLRLFEGAELPSLHTLITGGEAPFPADVDTYAARLRYFNAYGPTENTISSTMGRLAPGQRGLPSGGRPLANTSVHVCDSEGNPLPPGVVGELWLGGAGLALGYLGRPDLTAAAFIPTPRGRLYRSGDLGRWRDSGDLEILGRRDHQVKRNGIRIELGEIEHALATHPAVLQAVVLVDDSAKQAQSLWAFVRLRPGHLLAADSWREHLALRLPSYMIPSAVIAVPAIPLSHAGKVDKAALLALLAGRPAGGDDLPPEAGLEALVASTWSDLLGFSPIHRDDNFFALGGHSLLAIAVAHRLEETLGQPVPARELFAAPTLRGFAQRIARLAPAPAAGSSDRATEGQLEFWIAEQAGLDTRRSNMPIVLAVAGPPPPDQHWHDAWAQLVHRHDALRTHFNQDAGGVLRRSAPPCPHACFEISTQPDLPSALAHIRARQDEPFTMQAAPLWRAGLAHTPHQSLFWCVLHHSVGDGVSLGVLAQELAALLQGESLAPVTARYDLAAGREEAYLAGPACEDDRQYWRGQLRDLSQDDWPLDAPRPSGRAAAQTRAVHVFRSQLDSATANGLRTLARNNGASLHALVLTLMASEVLRRTGRPEFPLAIAASTRESAAEAGMVGYCVNQLPLCCRMVSGEPFEAALRTMQLRLAEGLHHSRYPFARMVRDYRDDHPHPWHPARHPLVDLAVTEDPGAVNTFFLPLDAGSGYTLREATPTHDMMLVHEAQADGSLALRWYANAAIYEKETAAAWLDSLAGWARFLVDSARPPESPLPPLLPAEQELLAAWESGPRVPPPAPDIPARFEYWAKADPTRPALLTTDGAQTYAAIDARANAIAHALLAEGVQRQEPVGVLTERSLALPETVLGIWKAGACYLPLLSGLPEDRLAFIARDAGIRVLVALDRHLPPAALLETHCRLLRPELLPAAFVESHAHPPQPEGGRIHGSHLAAILYTSGSTGVPKGVMLLHQGLANVGMAAAGVLEVSAADRVLLMSSPAFDAWLSDLLMAWTAGAAVVPVLRREMEDLALMREKLQRLGVTTATMAPSYLRLFQQADFPGLRVLMTVGEPPHRDDVRYYASRLRYVNGYGPTENTVGTSLGTLTADAPHFSAGRPLPNTAIQILNPQGDPVPPGAVGLIWVSGAQLARGYLNRPDLTQAAFVEANGVRRYSTGDLGRWLPDGNLEVLGRSDSQVKLRGQRVELGEIEHRLETCAGVRQAVALVDTRPDGSQTLWAFVALHPDAAEPAQSTWQEVLSQTLPSYMVPTAVVRVPSIPVNSSGKVDRDALLQAAAGHDADRPWAPALNRVERQVALAWAGHLGTDSISRDDDFFALGGNSLRAIAVVNQLRRDFECSINDLYEHPRLAGFAATCRERPEHLRASIQSVARHWHAWQRDLAAYETERDAALAAARREYETRNRACSSSVMRHRDYRQVLLTGATGYLGSYLLRELLARPDRDVRTLVRAGGHVAARARLAEVLCHYFGPEEGLALLEEPRLTVLAGDLRRDDLGLTSPDRARLAHEPDAIFHCAANVRHFGHFSEFYADNVAATDRLLKLAASRPAEPADFHFVSTLSVCGPPPEQGFQLFTEYDAAPATLDDNYYIRSKQEAERLVVAARDRLANATIHRVGNVVFAAAGGPLQFNIRENAFFRLVAAFLKLGAVPDDAHIWLCHVDSAARGLLLLADAPHLANEVHHLENSRRDTLAAFTTAGGGARACRFDAFLDRLEAAVDEPDLDAALTEVLEGMGLYRGSSPQPRARRLEIASDRTQALLAQSGFAWPPLPAEGHRQMLQQAARLFTSVRRCAM